MADLNDKNSAALGIAIQSMGKTQARKEFFPLVDSLSKANAAVTITDHDMPVAVLLSYRDYVALTSKACSALGLPKLHSPNLINSIKINSCLVQASDEISHLFEVSLKETAGYAG